MEPGMALLKNLFGLQKHHVQKVCIGGQEKQGQKHSPQSQESTAVQTNSQVTCKKGKKSSKKDKRRSQRNSIEIESNPKLESDLSQESRFHCPDMFVVESNLEEEDSINLAGCPQQNQISHDSIGICNKKHRSKSERRHTHQNQGAPRVKYGSKFGNLFKHSMSLESGIIHAVGSSPHSHGQCYCSSDEDDFKPTPIHIFCSTG